MKIKHDPNCGCFTGPEGAILEYRLDGSAMTIDRTFVPPAARGTGIAAALVVAALDTAGANGWKVVPECSYVAVYLKRHPEAHPTTPSDRSPDPAAEGEPRASETEESSISGRQKDL